MIKSNPHFLKACIAVVLLYMFLPKPSFSLDSSEPAPQTDQERQIIRAYDIAHQAVVNVSTQSRALDFFGETRDEGTGSGVIIDKEQGLIVTNQHVISNAQEMYITLGDSSSHRVELVGADVDNDIALLKIINPPAGLTELEFGDSSKLLVGQRVLAIGNPFGLSQTLTTGIISSLKRTMRATTGRLIEDVIQTDAAINPGSSGGPLLDTAGRIIGLNTAIVSPTGQSSGIGFAVPANQVRNAIPQLLKHGRVLRPKIGVIFRDTQYGPAILHVAPKSPAERAGFKGAERQVSNGFIVQHILDFSYADFVLAVNGQKVRNKQEVLDLLGQVKAGDEVEITLQRGLREKKRVVKLAPELG